MRLDLVRARIVVLMLRMADTSGLLTFSFRASEGLGRHASAKLSAQGDAGIFPKDSQVPVVRGNSRRVRLQPTLCGNSISIHPIER